jgi:putative transposase
VYHVLNRANRGARIFQHPCDYETFETVLSEALDRLPMRLLAYCIMPTHWHLVLWPKEGDHLSKFMSWLTTTHVRRWTAYRELDGMGHLYQGRFKSFPVHTDGHFLTVCRYVERNPVRASLAKRAEDWQWGSLWRRVHGNAAHPSLLAEWPLPLPANWLHWVNQPLTDAEAEALRKCVATGNAYGPVT